MLCLNGRLQLTRNVGINFCDPGKSDEVKNVADILNNSVLRLLSCIIVLLSPIFHTSPQTWS